MPVGIVTGLLAEARIAAPLGRALAGGGTWAGAEAAAERLIAGGARALLSFGLAGGLAPGLRAGECVVPALVVGPDERFPVPPALSQRLGGGAAGCLVSVSEPVASARAKCALREATGAIACDMESVPVARVAARHGVPFAVLRAICDPAERDLPPAALIAMEPGGGLALRRVLGSLARRPGQIGDMLALARDAAAARRALVGRVGEVRVRGGLMP